MLFFDFLFLPSDLINSAVGNNADKEKKLALTMLHNVIGAKRKGGQQWTKTYEQVMKRHLELCVDLKDHRTAKDGLHQYRNLCQTVRSYVLFFSNYFYSLMRPQKLIFPLLGLQIPLCRWIQIHWKL